MTRLFSLRSEIARRRYQRLPHVPVPHPVYDHTRSQWSRIRENTFGEFQASGTFRKTRVGTRQYGWKTARNYFAGSRHVAMQQHRHVANLAGLVVDESVIGIGSVDVLSRIVDRIHERLG